MIHQGEILQDAIKNSGISITHLVEELGITRPTIYRKFKDVSLDYSFVTRVGEIIGHDFSNDFTPSGDTGVTSNNVTVTKQLAVTSDTPAVSRNTAVAPMEADSLKQLMTLQQKYISLLEAYNELLLKVYGPK
ncbi:helix-turn-helix domain-containing protein [Hymenobacter sp. NST-14]|uniref:helix-turn-helix domain-containing protein n=1 Tax=Hymenobacter piscis TaxID=2839984 RepID=UPI001C0395DA|nr:helix-turn-helix domain-containing protein [Hymenobacter piscis]MBT9392233.1 helix-turn-helix domain-containing protein [Hymenobacter piscis]